ncbi:MAG: bifunctional DNA primase/polymerase [Syntrophobacteraceae bacterium]
MSGKNSEASRPSGDGRKEQNQMYVMDEKPAAPTSAKPAQEKHRQIQSNTSAKSTQDNLCQVSQLLDSRLQEALDAAARGWKVFPIAKNTKVPPRGFTDWENRASSSPEQVKTWAKLLPGCNWAVACGASNLIVIDVDVKNGKQGMQSLKALEAEIGKLSDTLIAITPSGGRHLYFRGTCPSYTKNPGPLGPDIDIKSVGGYVLLPGSKTGKGAYEWMLF